MTYFTKKKEKKILILPHCLYTFRVDLGVYVYSTPITSSKTAIEKVTIYISNLKYNTQSRTVIAKKLSHSGTASDVTFLQYFLGCFDINSLLNKAKNYSLLFKFVIYYYVAQLYMVINNNIELS